MPPPRPSFHELCNRTRTDKCTPSLFDDHRYQNVYPRFLEPLRDRPLKMLEIGLGCSFAESPGRSVALWKQYLPHVDLWEAESDRECVRRYNATLAHKNVSLLVGSQGDPAALMRWVRESGGRFDLIVDDGSHESQDQFTSLTCLWPHLNPGGFYFIEDLHYLPRDFRDRSKSYMLEVLGEWSARLTGAKSRAVYRFHHPSFSRTGEIGRRENGSATSDGGSSGGGGGGGVVGGGGGGGGGGSSSTGTGSPAYGTWSLRHAAYGSCGRHKLPGFPEEVGVYPHALFPTWR